MSIQSTMKSSATRRSVRRVELLMPALIIPAAVWGVLAIAQDAPSTAKVAADGAAHGASSFSMPAHYRAMVDQYCVTCHDGTNSIPAGQPLYLDDANYDDVARDNHIWEKVVKKLDIGQMPPKGKPHPGSTELKGLRNWLVGALDNAALVRGSPGEFTIHRINRTEYANAVRDIFGVEFDASRYLPTDNASQGFDNIGAALLTSPALIGGYISAAQAVATTVVGDPDVEPTTTMVPVTYEDQRRHMAGLPLGTRGGAVVRHYFPADGYYELSAELYQSVDGSRGVVGVDVPSQFDILVDGKRVHQASLGGRDDHVAKLTSVGAADKAAHDRMKARVFVNAGLREIGYTFVGRPALSQDVWETAPRGSLDNHDGSGIAMLGRVGISGPFNTTGVSDNPVRDRLFVCKPRQSRAESGCARRILGEVAKSAYRRPVSEADMSALMGFYDKTRKNGADFTAGIRATLPLILTNPAFLYRAERDATDVPVGAGYRIADLELASRLSFFIWGSLPDSQLIELATKSNLHESTVLEGQVKRMLADSRSSNLAFNFAMQWLELRDLAKAAPDPVLFQRWNVALRDDFLKETESFIDHIVRSNESALDLMNADYSFLNERLARHYGIPGVRGAAFRKVAVADPGRRGLLGHGSVLTLTSAATRTSPVFRGKWVLGVLLDNPPCRRRPTSIRPISTKAAWR
jgi:mono/diheme cytochrome c family protein